MIREKYSLYSVALHMGWASLAGWAIAHGGKSLISVFQEFSTSISKTFILARGLGTRL